jgi:hypothetical protein
LIKIGAAHGDVVGCRGQSADGQTLLSDLLRIEVVAAR